MFRLGRHRAGDGDGTGETGEAGDAEAPSNERSVLSRKELAKALRRQAYQRAKQARASDPRHLALKEAAKQRRRELYRQGKERQKAREAELEAKRKTTEVATRERTRRELAERVRSVVRAGAGGPGDPSPRHPNAGDPSPGHPSPSPLAGPSGITQSGITQSGITQSGITQSGITQSGSGAAEAAAPANITDLLARLRAESASLAAQYQSTPHLDLEDEREDPWFDPDL